MPKLRFSVSPLLKTPRSLLLMARPVTNCYHDDYYPMMLHGIRDGTFYCPIFEGEVSVVDGSCQAECQFGRSRRL